MAGHKEKNDLNLDTRVLSEFIYALNIARRQILSYPPGHPVINAAAKAKIEAYVTEAVAAGATLLVDGRGATVKGKEDGWYVGPTVLDHVTPEMDIYKQEIFAPVLSTVRAKTYDEAIELTMKNEYGNGTAIFTRDGDTARDFANRVNVGMVGINVPIPVPDNDKQGNQRAIENAQPAEPLRQVNLVAAEVVTGERARYKTYSHGKLEELRCNTDHDSLRRLRFNTDQATYDREHLNGPPL